MIKLQDIKVAQKGKLLSMPLLEPIIGLDKFFSNFAPITLFTPFNVMHSLPIKIGACALQRKS